MPKDFAKAFYNSARWKKCRKAALARDLYLCQQCHKAEATEVHHIKFLTPENINDPEITLSLDNLKSLCHECHTIIHNEQGSSSGLRSSDNRCAFDINGNVLI